MDSYGSLRSQRKHIGRSDRQSRHGQQWRFVWCRCWPHYLADHGWIFELIPSNGGWTYVDLHDFTGGADGAEPIGDLTLDAQGNLFGTASVGGSMGTCGENGCGVVWEITP